MKLKLMISFIVGVAITALLMIYVVARILNAERDELYRGAEKAKVIVAKTDLSSGTILTAATVGIKSVFKSSLGSYELTPSEFERIKDKQLLYPVRKFDPILSIYTDGNEKPFIDYTPNPLINRVYINDDLGVQIAIPNNWKQISSDEAGQVDLVWEDGDVPPSDQLSLGYFDPDTKEKVGIFIFTVVDNIESDEDREEFEEELEEDFEKIIWNNTPCYYRELEKENSVIRIYTIIHNETVLAFLIVIKQSHKNLGINIINEITIEQ